jgi:hypothetical protein
LNGSDNRDVVGDQGVEGAVRLGSVNSLWRVEIDRAGECKRAHKRKHIESHAACAWEDKQRLANTRPHSHRPFIMRPVAVLYHLRQCRRRRRPEGYGQRQVHTGCGAGWS